MKSPLTAIHAAAELLGRDLSADKREQFAETIVKETERLDALASRLLQLAAVEKRRDIETRESFALAPLVEGIIAAHALEWEARELAVTLDTTDTPAMHGDPLLIRQAIDNLFRNAMDFSPPGGSIELAIYPEGRHSVIDISDQGPGIPDYVGERVFERFFSLPRPDTGQKSTGLGLNFAREVAELHGGSLTLDDLNPGTRARLRLLHTIST
jgi:two-component system sensor histidine kinase CreC